MSVVVRRVHPISIHGGQVLDLELDQAGREELRVAETDGKLIGLVLERAGDDVHQELDDGVEGLEKVVEEDEANEDGLDTLKAEGLVKAGIADKEGEESKDVEHVELQLLAMVRFKTRDMLTWAIKNSLLVWDKLQCPNSWAKTATTSSAELFSIRVS